MPEINVTVETNPSPSLSFSTSSLPTQTGNAGKLLGTNGSAPSWTSAPTLQQLNIEGNSYPFLQLKNTAAPVDKKFSRLAHDGAGNVNLERVNDAYTAATRLIYWDASNNATLGAGTLTVNGGIIGVQGTLKGSADNSAWSIVAGTSTPGVATSGAWMSLYGGTHATTPGALVFGRGTGAVGIITTTGWGIGTTDVQCPLNVGGDIWINQIGSFYFTDANGTSPVFKSQSDNNFVFYGTSSTGSERPIWGCTMRSDTSPLQIGVPLKIGAAGVPLISILKATVSHTIGTLAAGAFLELTATVTGAIAGAMVHVGDGSPSNLIVRGYVATGNLVSVMYHNPTAASINAGTRSIDLFVFNV